MTFTASDALGNSTTGTATVTATVFTGGGGITPVAGGCVIPPAASFDPTLPLLLLARGMGAPETDLKKS